MKIKNKLKIYCVSFLVFLLSFNLISAYSINIPYQLKIKTETKELDKVEYDTFYITARKMYAVDRDETIYCLDMDKNYPSSNIFNESGSVSSSIENIINAGYPNRSPDELKLSSKDKAYFATQVAIWCEIEGYNINRIKGDNELVRAIHNIYKNGMESKYKSNVVIKKYIPDNKNIQRALVIFEAEEQDDNSINENIPKPEGESKPPVSGDNSIDTEEEAENVQPPYPPQEG